MTKQSRSPVQQVKQRERETKFEKRTEEAKWLKCLVYSFDSVCIKLHVKIKAIPHEEKESRLLKGETNY